MVHLCFNYGMTIPRTKSCGPKTKPYRKDTMNWTLKSKVNIESEWIMKLRDTASYSTRPMCKIKYAIK